MGNSKNRSNISEYCELMDAKIEIERHRKLLCDLKTENSQKDTEIEKMRRQIYEHKEDGLQKDKILENFCATIASLRTALDEIHRGRR